MSPWVTFGQRAQTWLRAVASRNPGRIQTTLNTAFGELYLHKGEAPDWEEVRECCGGYVQGRVPEWVQRVFLTVDVQKDRLEYAVRGWGPPEMSSAMIDEGELWGETDKPDVWEQLDWLADQEFDGHPVHAVAVDAGYRADEVYYWCSRHPGRSFATHGKDQHRKLFSATPVEVNRKGKTLKSGVKIWTFDAGHFKQWVHSRMAWPVDQAGAWMVPDDVTDDYCRQVTAETVMTLPSGKKQWIKIRADNHKFDCEVLQALLAQILNVRSLRADEEPEPEKKPNTFAELARRLNDG